jgi:O-antigen/teichoic acid export membrane protein
LTNPSLSPAGFDSIPTPPLTTSANKKFAHNAGWMLAGQVLRLVIQAAYFTVIARGLGAANYGAFIGVVALVNILFPFGTMGSGFLMVKNVSCDPLKFPEYFGRALLTTFVSSSILFGAVVVLSRFILPGTIAVKLVMLVAASDLFGMSISGMCGQAFQAVERFNFNAAINVMMSVARLGGAILLVRRHHNPSALQWGTFYFGSTIICACAALLLVLVKIGRPRFNLLQTRNEVWEGLYFSAGQSAQTIYNDIDKTMLARLGSLNATGIYGAAYRLIDVSFAPVWSMLAAAYPSFFRAGTNGIRATLRHAKPLLLRALGYAVLVCFVMLVGAGLVPRILGGEYVSTEEALRWLAVLPILKVVHFFLSDALTGAGFQGIRSAIQIGVAIFNVLINLWIIPLYSWRGAAWSSIASDALLAAGIGAAAYVLSRRAPALARETETFELRARA